MTHFREIKGFFSFCLVEIGKLKPWKYCLAKTVKLPKRRIKYEHGICLVLHILLPEIQLICLLHDVSSRGQNNLKITCQLVGKMQEKNDTLIKQNK